ncbi:MAG: type I-E CRISPR-associated protein Cse2/CasB [Desulfovibrio sp.]|jgi:CRISPR type I-E-associated protein CasB/Cse2|nr:type I-E CRISPR-associated protein Cse2/CasB [Desulfovibrio sp.]
MDSTDAPDRFIAETDIAALAYAVQKCGPGDQAELRRMVPDSPPLVFYRLLLRHIPDAWNGPEKERAWAAILQGMAMSALSKRRTGKQGDVHDKGQDKIHDPNLSLGKVLGQLFSESGQYRFWRLLQASDETFYDLLRHSLRMLAQERQAVNWMDIARLCLLSGETRSECCRILARDFCSDQWKQPSNTPQEQPGEEQGAAS